jgi:hypothetical protein
MGIRFTRVAGLATLVSTVALVAGTPAHASLINLSTCNNSSLTQPFMPWADPSLYELAPGGDGSLSGWSLQGGAQQVGGGETRNVSGTAFNSLSLTAGSVATSPQTCVDAAYPDLRFFDVAGTPGSSAAVSVLYDGVSIPVGIIAPGSSWEPTLPMPTLSAVPGLLSGGTANVQLQFTGLTGTVEVDDVYVDPWGKK